jgi:hypothetical protein
MIILSPSSFLKLKKESHCCLCAATHVYTRIINFLYSPCNVSNCSIPIGSISQWKFITLKVQYTTLDYSPQLFEHTYNLYLFSDTTASFPFAFQNSTTWSVEISHIRIHSKVSVYIVVLLHKSIVTSASIVMQ